MLYVVNFADEKYRDKQILNTKSAYEKGKADKVFEYSPKDLTELKLKFPAHFNVKRGYVLETLCYSKSTGKNNRRGLSLLLRFWFTLY